MIRPILASTKQACPPHRDSCEIDHEGNIGFACGGRGTAAMIRPRTHGLNDQAPNHVRIWEGDRSVEKTEGGETENGTASRENARGSRVPGHDAPRFDKLGCRSETSPGTASAAGRNERCRCGPSRFGESTWTWDAKLTTTLLLALIYVAYLVLRASIKEPN